MLLCSGLCICVLKTNPEARNLHPSASVRLGICIRFEKDIFGKALSELLSDRR